MAKYGGELDKNVFGDLEKTCSAILEKTCSAILEKCVRRFGELVRRNTLAISYWSSL